MKNIEGKKDDGLYIICSSSMGEIVRQIWLTITELADVTGLHRQTVSKRLRDIQPIQGSNCKRKIYDLKLALSTIYAAGGQNTEQSVSVKLLKK
ncbi:TPA: DUF1441 family protein [Klebsiella pneumoniae]|nr:MULTISPECIES: DUF1441 family protein [Klebsiella]MBJ9518199.1 DUF1441 family protein [Citrobacter freundii]HBY0499605.1 DUF1441 family protein [Klebsiella pneumoniae subsp. pneumoniae]HCA9796072.1 DUF1441 family protein [Klebsiella variicola subsp. variicola]HCM6828385.1 DUF1441 family protein [Klebsiella quasipneumoniae subsp. quasipneumoniae]EIX9755476.1 DUF1441 family protein [Klebsiella pneumoniae]